MKLKICAWAVAASTLFIVGCKRDLPVQNPANQPIDVEAKDLKVPPGFNFETEKTLDVKVKVANAVGGQRYVIKIYSDVPATGKLINTGLTNAQAEYATKVRVPAWEEYIYIEKISPDGSKQFEKVKANQFATALFTNGQQPNTYLLRKSSGMDCSTGCNVTYASPSNTTINVYDGDVACITGTIHNVTINVEYGGIAKISGTITGTSKLILGEYGTAQICASGHFTQITGTYSSRCYVVENAVLSVGPIYMDAGSEFKNWSDSLELIDELLAIHTDIENHGKWYSTGGSYTVLHNSNLLNNGVMKLFEMTVSGASSTSYSTVVNNNYIETEYSFYINEFCTVTNNCHIYSNDYISNWGTLKNNGYIKVKEIFRQTSFPTGTPPMTHMSNDALLSVKDIELNTGEIKGIGTSRAKLNVSGTTVINTGASVKGELDLCDANGIETNNGSIVSPAVAGCGGYIPASTCNPEGFGSAPVADTDGDGASDAQDEYPNDATRAFNSFYPNAASTATVAFEDLWPGTGDYEFNDLVLAFNIQQVLNADNKVVEYNVKMKVKAVGGSYINGFGFQLDDLVPADVSNVTGQILVHNLVTLNGNKTEAGQGNAVIICYDSPEPTLHRAAGSMFNTVKANGTGTSDSIYINVTFSSPVDASKLTTNKFNPFIFTNKRREYEIHMAGFAPTNLVNTSLFGTMQDRTNTSANYFYKTANGMPWGLMIPEDFAYPVEKASVTSAYPWFASWAMSGGSSNTNWYYNLPGHRNTSNIY